MRSDERIEAAAKALRALYYGDPAPDWAKETSAFVRDSYRKQARVALDAADAVAWRPIETAPRDGTKILACVVEPPSEYTTACNRPDGWLAIETGTFAKHGWFTNGVSGKPTHWQPLPAPPKPAS